MCNEEQRAEFSCEKISLMINFTFFKYEIARDDNESYLSWLRGKILGEMIASNYNFIVIFFLFASICASLIIFSN